ncbi:MAG: zinc ABC transporter substrate-binding protein [Deltaproteobacteria bacterium]|nr:MAG: zinc ABC transporter substrate-binding protein [Deltaproteobacteria bacterium]
MKITDEERMMMNIVPRSCHPSVAAAFLFVALSFPAPARATVKVVTTLPSYAAIAREVGGIRVHAESISRPGEDAHFVKPKPSLALMLQDADLFVTTGLDLELWAPTLVDKSGNARIRDGQPGFVAASAGVHMLDVPANASRAAGDVHVYGNPHIHTSPINAKVIAANIAAGLERVDPNGAADYRSGLAAFRRRIDEALYGKELVELLGSEALDPLAEKGTLISFLQEKSYRGKPLFDRLGGWMRRALPLRGKQIIAYHKNWIYFSTLFGLEIVDYVEAKPGIPPSARHVHDLIDLIERRHVGVLLSATYFAPSKPRLIAERTGCRVVRVPLEPGTPDASDYFALIDLWIDQLLAAFAGGH